MDTDHQEKFNIESRTVAVINILLMILASVSIVFHVEIAGATDSRENARINLAVKNDLSDEYNRIVALARSIRNKNKNRNVDAKIDISKNPTIGERHATIALIEFSDLQCPYCRRHIQGSMRNIMSDYIDSGDLLYIFFDFPFAEKHPLAIKAAEALRCAGDQGEFWKMRTHLYTNQKALHPNFLESHAKAIQLDVLQFNTCLNTGKYSKDILRDHEFGKLMEIFGTPTFFLGRIIDGGKTVNISYRIDGARPYTVFKKRIETLLNTN